MAATFDFTPKANTVPTAGTLYSTMQLKAFVITIKDDSNTAVDLRNYDGAYGSELDLLIRELAPMMSFTANAGTGVIHVIMDGHAVTAASLQVRVRHLVVALGLGTAVADNDSTVVEGTSFTVA
jgi:hypothetical protein